MDETKKRERLLFIAEILVLVVMCIAIGCVNKKKQVNLVYADSEQEITIEDTNEKTKSEWGEYFHKQILPNILAVVASIIAVVVTISPVLSTINNGAKLFSKSKQDFKESTDISLKSTAELLKMQTQLKEEIKQLIITVNTLKLDIRTELNECKQYAQNAVEIAKIGFGNTTELVKNGYASAIQKVGEHEERKESEEI